MNKVYKITGKQFGFSNRQVAEKFRLEYTPLKESHVGLNTILSLPKYKNNIIEEEMNGQKNIFNSIEECLKKFPEEEYFKFNNDRLKAKSSIRLKTPLKFDNGLKGDAKMTFYVNLVNYENLLRIVKKIQEDIKNKYGEEAINKDTNISEDEIICGLHFKNNSSIDPVAKIDFAQYKELVSKLKEIDAKIDNINKLSKKYSENHQNLAEELQSDESDDNLDL